MKLAYFIICLFISQSIFSQTIGGNAAYSFLKQPAFASLTSVGGINTSLINNDVALAFNNPSLLRKKMHQQVSTNFNQFFAGIQQYAVNAAFFNEKRNFTYSFGIQFLNYGKIKATDAIGNEFGNFNASDYAIQIAVAKQYKNNWHIGFTTKFINSNYFIYKSKALATDIGLSYYDSSKQLQFSFLVKNLGTQIQKYTSNAFREELPFDVQFGISKKLAKAPIQLSLTAHQLQQFNIIYQDTAFNNEQLLQNKPASFTEKLLSHLVVAARIYLKEHIDLNFGYNFLQRKDLQIQQLSNTLNGVSTGINIHLKKIQFQYATGFYQQNNFHQIGILFKWNGNLLNE